MALMTHKPPSPSESGSHDSSPELDQNSPDMSASTSTQDASPIALPAAFLPAQPASEPDKDERSARSTPTRSSPVDLTRSRSVGRGGCWTCRVRRKKCDEERVEGDSCKTCRRLQIKCLGWGPRRPDWMRDKEKVAEYKASIKAQLTRAGLIRGQPRAIYNSLTGPAPSSPYPTPSSASSDRYARSSAVAGPGPSTSSLRRSRGNDYPVYHPHPQQQRFNSPGSLSRPSTMMSGLPGLDPLGTPGGDMTLPSPFGPQFAQGAGSYNGGTADMHHHHPAAAAATSAAEMHHPMAAAAAAAALSPYSPTFLPNADLQPSLSSATLPVHEPALSQQDHISYYFEHVRRLQFVFAGNALTETLYYIVTSEPQGAVAYAISALAALHSLRTRLANGLEHPPQQPHEHPTHRRFYDQACFLLSNVKRIGSPYSETDAVAAIYLIAYHMLLGGGTTWTTLLEVAYDWFGQMGIHEEQNPKLRLVNMSPVQKFAAKATMWMDVMSAVVFVRPPRFLAVYRRLFGQGGAGGAGYWSAANNDQLDLRMDKLTGCPDEALLTIAETAALANWKKAEAMQGTLSLRELVHRAEQIEQGLRQRPTRTYAESPAPDAAMPSGMTAAAGMVHDIVGPDEATQHTVAQIYRDTAFLYLYTVVNDSHPGVNEISHVVNKLLEHFQQLPPSDFDRAIVFPITLTGCMAADPLFREILRSRCNLHQDAYYGGALAQARSVVDHLCTRRETLNRQRGHFAVDWRDVVREQWSSLFVV